MAKWDHDDLRDRSDERRSEEANARIVPRLAGNAGPAPVITGDPIVDAALLRGPIPDKPDKPKIPYKYHEPEILKEIANYIDLTYAGHYVGEDNIQSLDLILATGHATGFNIGNILKYGSRYGKKRGFSRDDLLKVVHYAIFELYNQSRNRET